MAKKETKKESEKPKFFQFETFRDMSDTYTQSHFVMKEPSSVNFLSYRKYKVTIELIEEPTDVLIERLNILLEKEKGNYYHSSRIRVEIERLKAKQINTPDK